MPCSGSRVESTFDRFAVKPNPNNAEHFIAVVFENGQWCCDNNQELVEFTPIDAVVLVAEVDFDADTVFGLYGQSGRHEGIPLGYTRGDLQFQANRWGGANNPGEFTITWTGFELEPDMPAGITPTLVGELRNGVAARDDAAGTGYLLYSQASVFDRFAASPPHPLNADYFIAVVFENGRWYYDNNTELVEFTPVDSDVLVAEVDFDADTVFGLYGQPSQYEGVALGYAGGDLQFLANRWGGINNAGEFAVLGTQFTRDDEVSDASQ